MIDVKEESLDENESSRARMESIKVSQTNIDSCIVCNNLKKLNEHNIGELLSLHSELRMSDLIRRCLGSNELHRNIDDCLRICCDCVLKLNEYDLACVTAERVQYELQQMLLQTDQLYAGGDAINSYKIHTMADGPNQSLDNNYEDEINEYCMIDKVEVFDSPTLQTQNEPNENDAAVSDLENDSTESIDGEAQNLVDSTKAKRIYECDTCPEKFNLWKELRVSEECEILSELCPNSSNYSSIAEASR